MSLNNLRSIRRYQGCTIKSVVWIVKQKQNKTCDCNCLYFSLFACSFFFLTDTCSLIEVLLKFGLPHLFNYFAILKMQFFLHHWERGKEFSLSFARIKNTETDYLYIHEFLVSKETVVLRRWERSKQKFGFIKRVDKGWITTVKDLESWRFER